MNLTNDQYRGIMKLEKWYNKYSHQVIDISGVVGTGSLYMVQKFIDLQDIDVREVMYLSYDQKQVLELAERRYHSYYIDRIYNYTKIIDMNSLSVINKYTTGMKYKWKCSVKKKLDSRYKLIIVFDSVLLNQKVLSDICSFGLPVVLIRDPFLLPSQDTYTFMRDPNIILEELHPELIRNPIVFFANKILHGEPFKFGNYDTVSVIPKKQMNLYNLKSSDMTIVFTDELRDRVNEIYREKILKQRTSINIPNERLIVMNDMYGHRLTNKDEKRIKVYLSKGTVGNIVKLNKHVITTKYVPMEFRAEFYYDVFDDLVMDRHYLNKISAPCRQIIPDETILFEYAYALTPHLSRRSHWDKVTLILDNIDDMDPEYKQMLMYTALTRAKKSLTILQ